MEHFLINSTQINKVCLERKPNQPSHNQTLLNKKENENRRKKKAFVYVDI